MTARQLSRELRSILEEIVAEEEPLHAPRPTWSATPAGKDSRILAALAKSDPARWHHLSISGRD